MEYRYRIIQAETVEVLTERIKLWLDRGWKLAGGVSVAVTPIPSNYGNLGGDSTFYQAIYLDD